MPANIEHVIRTAADLAAIEARGLDAFLPHPTPYGIIAASAAAWPERTAIRYLRKIGDQAADVVISYAALAARVRQAANAFRALGIGRNDTVAILCPHIPQAQIALWGAELAGRAFPINPALNADHLAALFKAAGAKVALVLGENPEVTIWPNVIGTLREMPSIAAVLDTDSEAPCARSSGSFETLMDAQPADRLVFDDRPGPDNIAAYFHTGGTTGLPKLAMHCHRNQAFVGRAAAAMYGLTERDVLVNGFPLFHVAGSFVYGLSSLSAGAELVIPGRLGMRNREFVKSIWKQVEAYRITAIGAVPTIISALNDLPVDADISSLRALLTGGSPLPTELADTFERNTGAPIRNILGMTECAGVVTIEPCAGPRTPGATGLRLPFTRVQAFAFEGTAIDLNRPCKPGETGIVALSGPNVAPGYSEARLNAGTFENGWLVSGDLGHVDDEQRVFITGRAKDVIIRGAHNIDPGTIEDALLEHPAVAIAAAVGAPDSYAGELPVAFVSLKSGATATEAELMDFIGPRVAEPAARPKHVWILPALPVTPIGKIYKPALRAIAARHAMADAIVRAGLAPGAFSVGEAEGRIVVTLTDAAPRDGAALVKKALLGMPAKYDVVS
ncbi:MAG: Long-chain-fatty-acid--CoA ligase [Pseudolabrys sp.]|jgi:fatty-acyl-CoA synthase|nr:Long-chain-fatty-acid--CoA ligase [Pseudolabrys sp.]